MQQSPQKYGNLVGRAHEQQNQGGGSLKNSSSALNKTLTHPTSGNLIRGGHGSQLNQMQGEPRSRNMHAMVLTTGAAQSHQNLSSNNHFQQEQKF